MNVATVRMNVSTFGTIQTEVLTHGQQQDCYTVLPQTGLPAGVPA